MVVDVCASCSTACGIVATPWGRGSEMTWIFDAKAPGSVTCVGGSGVTPRGRAGALLGTGDLVAGITCIGGSGVSPWGEAAELLGVGTAFGSWTKGPTEPAAVPDGPRLTTPIIDNSNPMFWLTSSSVAEVLVAGCWLSFGRWKASG